MGVPILAARDPRMQAAAEEAVGAKVLYIIYPDLPR